MAIVSLRGFLESGRFGSISLGADRMALERAFGEPEGVDLASAQRGHPPAIMKYGDVEFHFDPDAGSLWLIHIDRFSGTGGVPLGWGGCEIEPWVFRARMLRAELERTLDVAGLPFLVDSKSELGQEWLVFPSGVSVGFVTDPLETPGLVFVSASVRTGDANRDLTYPAS